MVMVKKINLRMIRDLNAMHVYIQGYKGICQLYYNIQGIKELPEVDSKL